MALGALEILLPLDAAVVLSLRFVQFHAKPFARGELRLAHKAQHAGFARSQHPLAHGEGARRHGVLAAAPKEPRLQKTDEMDFWRETGCAGSIQNRNFRCEISHMIG
eukprot:scaffold1166_cov261-Pinguiococcus_pyrenoidosus.AAC.49